MNTVMVLQSLFARPIRNRFQISTILPHLVSHFGVEAWRVEEAQCQKSTASNNAAASVKCVFGFV